jgi:hypothetical protein
MNSEERIEYYNQIQRVKNKYYENNKKHCIFKNSQKLDCTNHVSNNLDLQKMIQCTVFIIPDTNKIYYNYMVFKTYGNETNHLVLYDYVINLITKILEKYETFEFHVNLKTFTISACQRYYGMITSTFDDNKFFTDKMGKLFVYHTPSIVDQVNRLLYSSIKDILPKVEYFYKDSDEKIKVLFDM